MKYTAFSWFCISLLALSMLAGMSTAQDSEAECPPDGSDNDPNRYDTDYGGVLCEPDSGERIDEVPPSKVPATRFMYVGISNFTFAWADAYDMDNEDVDADDGYPRDGSGHPNPEPGKGNGTVDHYVVYNNTIPFTSVEGQPSQTVTANNDKAVEFDNLIEFTDLEAGQTMHLGVSAVDARGNEGAPVFVSVTTASSSVTLSSTSATVNETAEEYTYTVGLNDIPQLNTNTTIEIELIQGDPIMGEEPVTINKQSVRLNQSHPTEDVTVQFTDDDLGTGDRSVILRHTVNTTTEDRDTRYDDAPVVDLNLLIDEDDVEPAIDLLNHLELSVTEGEDVTFQVKLNREPTDDVFIFMESDLPDRLPLVVPHYLHFSVNDWDTYKDVTLHGVDNLVIDGDRLVTVSLTIDPEGTAQEYVDRAPNHAIKIYLFDNEADADNDSILDSEDDDPNDRFNDDFRPREFTHQLAVDGTSVSFSWTARHLDERITHYILWEFRLPDGEPVNVADVPVVSEQRFYNHTIPFDSGNVYTYELQAVLIGDDQNEDGNFSYDEETAVPLGRLVFLSSYYDTVCSAESGADGTNDADGDGVCNAFEELIGTDPNDPDTDGDGRTDYQELFEDGATDPADASVQSTTVPAWAANTWMITGSLLLLASLVIAIISFARKGSQA